jgi:hypothetical protein
VDIGGRLESRRGFDSLQPHNLGLKIISIGSDGPRTLGPGLIRKWEAGDPVPARRAGPLHGGKWGCS